MRRIVGPAWPALSAIYGLHPWDVERLSYSEIDDYMADLEARGRAARQRR